MSSHRNTAGSVGEFRANWKNRKESLYNHWVSGPPINQVQFAFRNHWEVFSEFMGSVKAGKSLEVGCGRGSLSSYFADNGWDATLLDTSEDVLAIARDIFDSNNHSGTFVSGDANRLPFSDEEFDVVSSIGLLEHFENANQAIREQWRVLKPNGWVFAYIVPDRPTNLQKYFNWVNAILKVVIPSSGKNDQVKKEEIYRNDYDSSMYLSAIKQLHPTECHVSGMYSMPMVSHSPEFPFSLLPAPLERVLVSLFSCAVAVRQKITGRHGWLCSEEMGQAFLIAFKKGD